MKTATLKSWNLTCCHCGERGEINLDLNALAAGVTCASCGETCTVETPSPWQRKT